MILHKLKMCNFRQFFGEQEIEFATDTKNYDTGTNVTVAVGVN